MELTYLRSVLISDGGCEKEIICRIQFTLGKAAMTRIVKFRETEIFKSPGFLYLTIHDIDCSQKSAIK